MYETVAIGVCIHSQLAEMYANRIDKTARLLFDRLNGLEWHPVKLAAFPLTISLANGATR